MTPSILALTTRRISDLVHARSFSMSSGVVSSMNERTTLAFFLSHAAAICSSFTSAFCVSVSSTWTPSKSVFGDRGVDG